MLVRTYSQMRIVIHFLDVNYCRVSVSEKRALNVRIIMKEFRNGIALYYFSTRLAEVQKEIRYSTVALGRWGIWLGSHQNMPMPLDLGEWDYGAESVIA